MEKKYIIGLSTVVVSLFGVAGLLYCDALTRI